MITCVKGSVESTHKVPTSHYHTKHCHAEQSCHSVDNSEAQMVHVSVGDRIGWDGDPGDRPVLACLLACSSCCCDSTAVYYD